MFRPICFAFMMAAVLTAASEARAQYGYARGYGGYGWHGWGSTPGSSMARGMGMLSMGRGMYNVNTAQARSINADTAMQMNQYMYESQQNELKKYVARKHKLEADNEKAYSQIQDRLRNHPTARDVTDGDALNTLLGVLLNPSNADASLQQIKTPLRPDSIANIPFELASEGMTACLDRMTMDGQWPQAVLGDEFRPERDGLRQAIKAALAEDKEGEIDPDTVAAVQTAIDRLRNKFEKLVPQTSPDYVSAHWSLNAMNGITKMLYSPTMDKVLSELEDYQGTTVGDLLGFMQAFNLRFGEAKSYSQRMIYQKLYPMLAEQANSLSPATGDVTAVASSAATTVAKVGAEAVSTAESAGGDAIDGLKSAAINFFKGWKL
jgi:DNA-binding ferritin-like protein (Dps family)